MRKGLLVLVLLAVIPGIAGAATLFWTNPATFTDGTTIGPEYLSGKAFIRIYSGDSVSGPWTRFPDGSTAVTYPINAWDFPAGYPTGGKWYTVTFVVPCDPSIPVEPDNKCASDFAYPVQYVAPPPPPPPPPAYKTPAAPTGLGIR